MRFSMVLLLMTALCVVGAAQQAGSTRPASEAENRRSTVVQAAADAGAGKAAALKMTQDLQTDPGYQLQRQRFEAVLQELVNDGSLHAQRERMQYDLDLAGANSDVLRQKSSLEADLRQAEGSLEMAERPKQLQREIDRARPSAPGKSGK